MDTSAEFLHSEGKWQVGEQETSSPLLLGAAVHAMAGLRGLAWELHNSTKPKTATAAESFR